MKTILITGASGFYGKSVINALKKIKSTAYKAICVYHTQELPLEKDDRFIGIKADLMDPASHERIMNEYKPTHIIHLAWDVTPVKFWQSQNNLHWLNISCSLFKNFCNIGGKSFLCAGTMAEYGTKDRDASEDEINLSPSSLYGECKVSLHKLLIHIRDQFSNGPLILWPRIGSFFGENEAPEKLIPKIIDHIQYEKVINLSSPETKLTYAHVRYAGEAIIKSVTEGNIDLTFNLTGPQEYTMKSIADYILQYMDRSKELVKYDAYQNHGLARPLEAHNLQTIVGYKVPNTFFQDLDGMMQNKLNRKHL